VKKKILFLALAMVGAGIRCNAITEGDIKKQTQEKIIDVKNELIKKNSLNRPLIRKAKRSFGRYSGLMEPISVIVEHHKIEHEEPKYGKGLYEDRPKYKHFKRTKERNWAKGQVKKVSQELRKIFSYTLALYLKIFEIEKAKAASEYEPKPKKLYDAVEKFLEKMRKATHEKDPESNEGIPKFNNWFKLQLADDLYDFFREPDFDKEQIAGRTRDSIEMLSNDLLSEISETFDDGLRGFREAIRPTED